MPAPQPTRQRRDAVRRPAPRPQPALRPRRPQPRPAAPAGPVEPDPAWTEPEARLWRGVLAGQVPALGMAAIRAGMLRTVMTTEPWCKALPASGLRFERATVQGDLLVDFVPFGLPLWIEYSVVEGRISLRGTRVGEFSLDGTHVLGGGDGSQPAANFSTLRAGYTSFEKACFDGSVEAILARIESSLWLPGLRVRGNLDLSSATVDASVELGGARISGALTVANLKTGQHFSSGRAAATALRRTVIGGPLVLDGAQIGGTLELGRTSVFGRDERARGVAGQGIRAGTVLVHGLAARALVDFTFSTIGNLDLANQGRRLRGLELHSTAVAGELLLRGDTRWTPDAMLDLRNARVGALQDDGAACWPALVHLQGLSLDRLGGYGASPQYSYMARPLADFKALLQRTLQPQDSRPGDDALRWQVLPAFVRALFPAPGAAPAWLRARLLPRRRDLGFRPSTWRLFAAKLRELGRPQLAEQLEFDAREIERRNAMFPRRQQLQLLRVVIGYGVSTAGYFRALVIALGWTVVCAAVGAWDAQRAGSDLAAHSAGWWLIASFDHILPIVVFDKAYADVLPSHLVSRAAKLVFDFGTCLGWVIGALLAAGLAGFTQRPR